MDTITAYSTDGRIVEIPRSTYEDWKLDVMEGNTHRSLLDYAAYEG